MDLYLTFTDKDLKRWQKLRETHWISAKFGTVDEIEIDGQLWKI